jgi:acetoacetyl-CoA synthetase
MSHILWTPSQERINSSLIKKFMDQVPYEFLSYQELHKWSVENMEEFWAQFWSFSNIIYSRNYDTVLENPVMPGARWFSGAELNYAENLLAGNPDQLAIISAGEGREDKSITFRELNKFVAAAQHSLQKMGVKKGTRVAAFVPNCMEAVILMLATAASGAIWTSCSPDFGARGVIDRFAQVEPSILIVANGYCYNGKVYTLEDKINGILNQIKSIDHLVRIDFIEAPSLLDHPSVTSFEKLIANNSQVPHFTQVPFDHPLYIMYSSGTTGVPKSIIHSVGGSLIQHLKEHQLQYDIQGGRDTLFWFTTCGWMMWNWTVSALASGATIVLYDGSPAYPDLGTLWRLAERAEVSHFGTSPKFLAACKKGNAIPKKLADLSKFRSVLSTGSPLNPEQFDWVYENIHPDIQLSSISGGTDILAAFLGGSPLLPVCRGELQCAELGFDVQSWNKDGEQVIGESGELVCTKPFPSMPIGFWNDPDGSKYHAAYFEDFEGVWTHGDYVAFTESGGAIIYGRSDTTLNPGGVRIGTAEIYRVVESMDEVRDSIVVGKPFEGDVEIILFVKLNSKIEFSSDLEKKIRHLIRRETTPRHVPKYIFPVKDVPHTISGKKVEKAVLSALTGKSISNKEALFNAECLDEYVSLGKKLPT